MPNYRNGKIYKLVNNDGVTYVGSTCQQLNVRKAEHASKYRKWKQGSKTNYTASFEVFESNASVDIILLENFPCNNKEELHARERHYVDTTTCVNVQKPCRTNKQWREDNKDHVMEHNKQMVDISFAICEIYSIHNPISFLK